MNAIETTTTTIALYPSSVRLSFLLPCCFVSRCNHNHKLVARDSKANKLPFVELIIDNGLFHSFHFIQSCNACDTGIGSGLLNCLKNVVKAEHWSS